MMPKLVNADEITDKTILIPMHMSVLLYINYLSIAVTKYYDQGNF